MNFNKKNLKRCNGIRKDERNKNDSKIKKIYSEQKLIKNKSKENDNLKNKE